MTVRNNKNKIIQFKYGDDDFDTVKVENQQLTIYYMSIGRIFNHLHISTKDNNVFISIYWSKNVIKQARILN